MECPKYMLFLNFYIVIKPMMMFTSGSPSSISHPSTAHFSDDNDEARFNYTISRINGNEYISTNSNNNSQINLNCEIEKNFLDIVENEKSVVTLDDYKLVAKLVEEQNKLNFNSMDIPELENELFKKCCGYDTNPTIDNNRYTTEIIQNNTVDAIKINNDNIGSSNDTNNSLINNKLDFNQSSTTKSSLNTSLSQDCWSSCSSFTSLNYEQPTITSNDISSSYNYNTFRRPSILSNVVRNDNNRKAIERRNRNREISRNFSMWIGVTSCVWGVLLYLAKNYNT